MYKTRFFEFHCFDGYNWHFSLTILNIWKNECRSYNTLIHTPYHMHSSIIQEFEVN